MKLPPFPDLSPAVLQRIAEHHGLAGQRITRMPEIGIFNAVFQIGARHVLRIPRHQKAFTAALRKESLVAPAARAAGIQTPELIAFGEDMSLLPVPYAIYAFVDGRTLGLLESDRPAFRPIWGAVGADLARLHTLVEPEGALAKLTIEALPDPRDLTGLLAEQGYFTKSEGRWLRDWLELLAPALARAPRRLLHGDVQAMNIIASIDPPSYVALLDWGAAGCGDPAWDFAGMPLRVVPAMLEGYQGVAPIEDLPSFTARILWRQIQVALFLLQREPQPNRSWAERPIGALLDIMRFLLANPAGPWERWRPPA
jgi:aminoglycoside phosphotransferase (APT) family kinase protein